jgi:putative ABC transport system permease protein
MQTLWQDLRLAVRMLRVHSAYPAIAVATLALGIGANTAIFSAINGVFLRPLPYANTGDILVVEQPAAKLGPADHGLAALELEDYDSQATSLAIVDEYRSMSFTLYGQGEPARVTSGVVSAQYFDDLGVRPILGRSFRPGEDAIGAPANAILSYEFWQSKFAGDPHVVGRTFTMNDKVHTIVGVLPPLPKYADANDLYIPTGSCPFRSAAS